MKLSEIVAAQVKTARETQADLQRVTRTEADLLRPTATLNARVARVETRINALERQRADTLKRLDEAILEQRKLRDQLVKDAQNLTSRFPDVKEAPSRPVSGRPATGIRAAAVSRTATPKEASKPKTAKKPATRRPAGSKARKPPEG